MVRPPYWVAARIYGAAAGSVARARISGAYTLNTGKDLDDLPPKLYLDVVESWIWERFTKQEDADRWVDGLNAAPSIDLADVGAVCERAAMLAVLDIEAMAAGADTPVDDAPPGWENAALVTQQRVVGIVMD